MPEEEVHACIESNRRLQISVIRDESIGYTVITSNDLNGIYGNDITYYGFSDISIKVNEESMPLANAIRDGYISTSEIIAYARIDAKAGKCTESYKSKLGYSKFTYQYPEYEIQYSYDVFELSNGELHLIESFSIYPPNRFKSSWSDIIITDANGKDVSIYSEDWGLSFKVKQATANGLTLTYTQSGGIQIGTLVTSHFTLFHSGEKRTFVPLISPAEENFPHIAIHQNSLSDLTLDWTKTYGELPSGDYTMVLYIEEKYDATKLSPLIKNYTDLQGYTLNFSIS